ncbi:maturation protein [ssRNA phage SRR7976325_26]|uniref:Maturation protein n=1 Tax=ssRNA phage SRR7976325_26 TaxID=2786714 RepID=A0A8S5L5I5_9VIRU|nr:maturation protein [ssRNA phage SRR7976325_26]DAD52764.1 TPA_asm: maturation protein [ssRNA phage SRR7976325_26]
MVARSRELDSRQQLIGTSTDQDGNVVDSNSVFQGTIVNCNDTVGQREDANPFDLTIRSRYMPLIDGTRFNTSTNIIDRYFNGRPVDVSNWTPPDPNEYLPGPTFYDLDQLAWKTLAETNPSEPHVSVPQVIGELKDIPSLVKGWGTGLIRDVAKGHLTLQWAIKPMIGDAWKLYNFVKASQERLNQLKNLRDGKSVRKRVSLSKGRHDFKLYNVLLNSSQIWVTATLDVHVVETTWGSAQWVLPPDTFIHKMDPRELELFARRLTGGFNIRGGLAAAWELLPWSWLVDWFGNVGDMISATNNSIPLTYRNVCIMRRAKCTVVGDIDPVASNYDVRFTPAQLRLEMERKQRWPWSPVIPVPTPRIPIINGRKWSILAALTALRVPTRGTRH